MDEKLQRGNQLGGYHKIWAKKEDGFQMSSEAGGLNTGSKERGIGYNNRDFGPSNWVSGDAIY